MKPSKNLTSSATIPLAASQSKPARRKSKKQTNKQYKHMKIPTYEEYQRKVANLKTPQDMAAFMKGFFSTNLVSINVKKSRKSCMADFMFKVLQP